MGIREVPPGDGGLSNETLGASGWVDTGTVFHVDSAGCLLECAEYGDGPATVVLVHGAGAHRQWWYRLVDAMARDCRVVTVDLSGHGNSGHRETYGVEVFARDIATVAMAVGDSRPLVLAGHSAGGRWAGVATALVPGIANRLVIFDSQFPPVSAGRRQVGRVRPVRYFATREEAWKSFRLMPEQPEPSDEILQPLFDYAVKSTPRGWCWKADGRTMIYRDDAYVLEQFSKIAVPVTYAYGTLSAMPREFTAPAVAAMFPEARIVRIDGGYHHLPLDSPQACLDVLLDTVKEAAR